MRDLYKKNKLGAKYTRLITSSPWPVLIYLTVGIALFVTMTLSVEIDVIRTYPAILDKNAATLTVNSSDAFSPGKAFVYSNRNEFVASVEVEKVAVSGHAAIFYIASSSIAKIISLSKNVYIDVPAEKESLFRQVVMKAGKNHK